MRPPLYSMNPSRRNLTSRPRLLRGDPKDVILREATEWHADRVVVGSHGYGRVGSSVGGHGATAERPMAAHLLCERRILRTRSAASSSCTSRIGSKQEGDATHGFAPSILSPLRMRYRRACHHGRGTAARASSGPRRHATIAAVAATADALSTNLAQMQFLEDARNTLRQLGSEREFVQGPAN